MPSLKIFALSLLFHTYKILYISNYIKYSKGLASPRRPSYSSGLLSLGSLSQDASPFEYFMVKCKLAIGGLKTIEKDNQAIRKD